jgi:mono/diheme cytochrome c family protein
MTKLISNALFIAGLLIPLGCGKVYNSSTYDSSTYGSGGSTGSALFLAAKAVIDQHCSICHTQASHMAWAGMGEQDFVSRGLVTPGSLESSVLYTKISGNRTAINGNMPQGGAPLSSSELDILEAWIQGIPH